LKEGYSLGSVNVRLSTVKTYAGLAWKAGALDTTAYALIKSVSGYSHKERKHVDKKRKEANIPTRKGIKKAEAVKISEEQARKLKAQPDTPQGRRDALIMCLLLDHGLRVGKVSRLTVENFDLGADEFTFYRPKVDKEQTHWLSSDTAEALAAYLERDALPSGPLLRGSRKDGRLLDPSMSKRSITDRVRVLGQAIGLEGLSAHDCRHYWATRAAKNGTEFHVLREAGGWNSLAMPLRYIEDAKIANEDVKLA
jgi:integrase